MDEGALLSNIAIIISKDLVVDECNIHKKPKHFLRYSARSETSDLDTLFPLVEATDESEDFFLQHYLRGWRGACKNKQNEPITTLKPIFTETKVNLLNKFENIEFEGYLHMSKISFLKIFQSIRYSLSSSLLSVGMPPETVFSLSLWKLTTNEHFEEIAKRFNISQHNCEIIIRQFWDMISDKYESYIKWPNAQFAQQLQLRGFQKHSKLKKFTNLFGILAIKRLDIFLASENAELSVIFQIVCDVDQKVIDCFVELEQGYTFDDTPMGEILSLNENTMPKSCYLIGNKSFPLKSYLMTPYANPCFRKEHEFNRLLEPGLTLGLDTLDVMAKRFNALYALEAKDLGEVRKILETICALHNLCVSIEDDYVDRKREVVSCNWASHNVSQVISNEQNAQGLQKRTDLTDMVAK